MKTAPKPPSTFLTSSLGAPYTRESRDIAHTHHPLRELLAKASKVGHRRSRVGVAFVDVTATVVLAQKPFIGQSVRFFAG